MERVFTNLTYNNLKLNYRTRNGAILSVELPPLSFNEKRIFASDEAFNSFWEQNKQYSGKLFLVGNTSQRTAEKTAEEIDKSCEEAEKKNMEEVNKRLKIRVKETQTKSEVEVL